MDKVAKIISVLKDLFTRVKKAVPQLGLEIEHQQESKNETFTVEIGKNGSCCKRKIHHKKSNTSFSIGILRKEGDNKSQLFISANNACMLLSGKYLLATPICCNEEPSNEEGEVWYTAAESINKDYFSETTSETRKDEIIEQILMEVVKNLDGYC